MSITVGGKFGVVDGTGFLGTFNVKTFTKSVFGGKFLSKEKKRKKEKTNKDKKINKLRIILLNLSGKRNETEDQRNRCGGPCDGHDCGRWVPWKMGHEETSVREETR